MKNILEGINSKLGDIEEHICPGRQNRGKSPNQNSKKKKKSKILNEDQLKNHWDNIKHTNIHIIGVPEGKEKEKKAGKLLYKIMVENFSNLEKETEIQVQEAQKVPNKMNPKRSTQRHIKIKTAKFQDKKDNIKGNQ